MASAPDLNFRREFVIACRLDRSARGDPQFTPALVVDVTSRVGGNGDGRSKTRALGRILAERG